MYFHKICQKLSTFSLILCLLFLNFSVYGKEGEEHPKGKVGIVYLHSVGADGNQFYHLLDDLIKKWGFPVPDSSRYAVYTPTAQDRTWFDLTVFTENISSLSSQQPAVIRQRLIQDNPQLRQLKTGVEGFMTQQGITYENLHLFGYSQGSIQAQLLFPLLERPCHSLLIAGAPWLYPDPPHKNLPKKVILGMNTNDPIFPNLIHQMTWGTFQNTMKMETETFNQRFEVVLSDEGHEISKAMKQRVVEHLKTVF